MCHIVKRNDHGQKGGGFCGEFRAKIYPKECHSNASSSSEDNSIHATDQSSISNGSTPITASPQIQRETDLPPVAAGIDQIDYGTPHPTSDPPKV